MSENHEDLCKEVLLIAGNCLDILEGQRTAYSGQESVWMAYMIPRIMSLRVEGIADEDIVGMVIEQIRNRNAPLFSPILSEELLDICWCLTGYILGRRIRNPKAVTLPTFEVRLDSRRRTALTGGIEWSM